MQYHHVRGLAGKWQNYYLYQVCTPLQSKRPVKHGKTLAVAMSCDDVMSQFDALLLTAIVQCSKCQGFLMDLMGFAARG